MNKKAFHEHWYIETKRAHCLFLNKIIIKTFLIFSILISVSLTYSADFTSRNSEIIEYTRQIEKLDDQISLEQSKSDKSTRELKYLTDKRNRLLEQKIKKMIDLKDSIQKNIDSNKKNIQKLKNAESNNENTKQLKKAEEELKNDETALNGLNLNIDAAFKCIKKQQEDEKKEDEKKKKAKTVSDK